MIMTNAAGDGCMTGDEVREIIRAAARGVNGCAEPQDAVTLLGRWDREFRRGFREVFGRTADIDRVVAEVAQMERIAAYRPD